MGIFRKIFSFWIFWYCLIAIVMVSATFYLILTRGAKSFVTQQLLSYGQIIARAEAGNTLTFFQKFGDSVATLAQLSSVESHNANTTAADLDTFVEQWRGTGIVGGLVLTDKNGTVKFNSNIMGTRDLGASLADRDYFLWAKTQGGERKYFINKPVTSRLGPTKGQTIIVVASPVYQNGVFAGVVAASVKLETLLKNFFGLMKISDLTKVYLVDGHGDLLYSSSAPELFSGDSALKGSIKSVLGTTEEGQFQTEKYLINYSPIILGTQSWLLIISSPAQEVINFTRPFYIRQIAVLILTAFTILLFAAIVIRKNKV